MVCSIQFIFNSTDLDLLKTQTWIHCLSSLHVPCDVREIATGINDGCYRAVVFTRFFWEGGEFSCAYVPESFPVVISIISNRLPCL